MFVSILESFEPTFRPLSPGQGWIWLTGVLCLVSACASSSSRPLFSGPASALVTPKSGDAIEVRFSREPDRGGTFQIDDTGEVPLPFLGRLQILELNTGELRALLTRRYEEQLPNQTVYVRVLRKVRVLGAVTEPGVYFVDDTTNLADAIARAGGVRPDGNLTAVRIRREGREVTTNIKVAAMSVPKLESGDQIFVPRRTWLARNGMSLLASVITVAGIVAGIVVR